MKVKELLIRKKFLANKLSDLEIYLNTLLSVDREDKAALYSKVINYKFKLLSEIRQYKIILDNLNRSTIIVVDDVELSVYEVLLLLSTLKEKIDTFSLIIREDKSASLDVFSLLEKREVLTEEYSSIYFALINSDVVTDLEN